MPRRYSEHPAVKDDIEDIVDFIAYDGPSPSIDHALKVETAIAAALRRIKNNPFQGPKYLDLADEFPNLRRCQALPYRNYLVFYDLTEEEVRILYVFEASRDIPERIREEQRY